MTTPDPQYVLVIYDDNDGDDNENYFPEHVIGPFDTKQLAVEAGRATSREWDVYELTSSMTFDDTAPEHTPAHLWLAHALDHIGWPTEWLDETYSIPPFVVCHEIDHIRTVETRAIPPHAWRVPVTVRYVIDTHAQIINLVKAVRLRERSFTPW